MVPPPSPSTELSDWLARVRHHLLLIARRRVGPDDAEDVVQTAMTIISERGLDPDGASVAGLPPVAWCLQVLRNVIGNHYRRRRTHRGVIDEGVEIDRLQVPLEGRDDALAVMAIDEGLAALERQDESCARYLRRLADGVEVARLAEELALEAHALYQRIYRCRRKFRAILREMEVLP